MPNDRPNILIFMTDQEQAGVVGPDHPCLTPNADRLSREGVRFTNAYCPTAHCCPARATLMTGLYPSGHGIYNNVSNPTAIHQSLRPGTRLWSEDLRASGYELAYAGKWHVCDDEDPADRGWRQLEISAGKGSYMHRSIDMWRRFVGQEAAPVERGRGQILRPGWGHYQVYGATPDVGDRGYEGLHDYKVVRSALDALPTLAGGSDPWCLYVGTVGPHDPYIVPERFARMYDPADVPLPASLRDTLDDKPRAYQRVRRQYWGQLSDDELREAIAHYWAYCTLMDAMLGEVLDALDATGQADNTLVLFLSDHGDYAGAHGLFCKGVPAFREAYNVPCIVRWPRGVSNAGRTVDSFVTLADVGPTLLALTETGADRRFDGRSLAPFLRAESPLDWPDAFHSQFNGVELYYSQRVVQTRSHKYVYNGFDYDELYDLTLDPDEMVNVAEDPAYRDAKRDLVQRMWRFAAATDDAMLFNPYATVAFAPWGPADALAAD